MALISAGPSTLTLSPPEAKRGKGDGYDCGETEVYTIRLQSGNRNLEQVRRGKIGSSKVKKKKCCDGPRPATYRKEDQE